MRRTMVGLVMGWGFAGCATAPPPSASQPPASAEPEPGAVPGSPGPEDGVVASPPGRPSTTPSAGPGLTYKVVDMGISVPDEWRACSAAADCELVVTTCCDHCNGGKTVSVNKARVKDVSAKYPKQCDKVACTLRGCLTRPECAAGRCVLEWASGP